MDSLFQSKGVCYLILLPFITTKGDINSRRRNLQRGSILVVSVDIINQSNAWWSVNIPNCSCYRYGMSSRASRITARTFFSVISLVLTKVSALIADRMKNAIGYSCSRSKPTFSSRASFSTEYVPLGVSSLGESDLIIFFFQEAKASSCTESRSRNLKIFPLFNKLLSGATLLKKWGRTRDTS